MDSREYRQIIEGQVPEYREFRIRTIPISVFTSIFAAGKTATLLSALPSVTLDRSNTGYMMEAVCEGNHMWWLIGLIVVLLFYIQVFPRVVQFFLDLKGRRIFREVACPKCGRLYDSKDIRRAKHLMRTKVVGGPPPEPFSAVFYEAWGLKCSACGSCEDFDREGNVIAVEDLDNELNSGPVEEPES